MKRITLSLILPATLLTFFLSGCHKDTDTRPEQPVNSINDLKVNEEFDWKTTRQIVLSVTGMSDLPLEIKKTIRISTTDGGIVFSAQLIDMRQNSQINFSVPTYISDVLIQCGTIQDTVPVLGNTMQFNLINN